MTTNRRFAGKGQGMIIDTQAWYTMPVDSEGFARGYATTSVRVEVATHDLIGLAFAKLYPDTETMPVPVTYRGKEYNGHARFKGTAGKVCAFLVVHFAQFELCPNDMSLRAYRKNGYQGCTPEQVAIMKRIASVEATLQAVKSFAEGNSQAAVQAATVSPDVQAAGGQATSEPDKTNKAKGKKLPSTTGNTLPVERVALLAVMDLLAKGIDNESWQEIADARKMLGGLLS